MHSYAGLLVERRAWDGQWHYCQPHYHGGLRVSGQYEQGGVWYLPCEQCYLTAGFLPEAPKGV
jgi:hypothetical protein